MHEDQRERHPSIDHAVFKVAQPAMDLTRAVLRMERELPAIHQLPRPAQLSRPVALDLPLLRRKLPPLPPLPALSTPSTARAASFLDTDDELKDLLDKREVRTLVVGIGGAGNNMTSRFQALGIPGCRTMCVNTDVQDLYYSNADEKVLIGKRLTRGLGAGNNHEMGELAAEEDFERLKAVMDADLVFLTCGLGGGTGTGASPLVARAARERGAVVVSIVSMPFSMEGPAKEHVAYQGLKRLAEASDTVIPLSNQHLVRLMPAIKIHQGFKIMDEILTRSVRGVLDLVTRPGLVNLDFADIKSIIERKPADKRDAATATSVIGMTEVSKLSEDHLVAYTTKALNNPLIEPDTRNIKQALVGITGDFNVSLKQVDTIVSTVQGQIHEDANVKWGYIQDPSLQGRVRITVLGSGFPSPMLDRALQDAC